MIADIYYIFSTYLLNAVINLWPVDIGVAIGAVVTRINGLWSTFVGYAYGWNFILPIDEAFRMVYYFALLLFSLLMVRLMLWVVSNIPGFSGLREVVHVHRGVQHDMEH